MAWTDETRSRRRPYQTRCGPRSGHQRCGPARTRPLTDAGRETVRQYRAAMASESPGEWVCYTVRTMIGGTRVMWRRRGIAGAREGTGMYYTPPDILAIIDPSMGSGAFLAELASNPPWGQS